MATLNVVAQGSHVSSDSRLFLNVLVTDQDGAPINGLKNANFKVAQLAPDFDSDIGITLVQDLGATFSELARVYRRLRNNWASAGDGTFAFHISAWAWPRRPGAGAFSCPQVVAVAVTAAAAPWICSLCCSYLPGSEVRRAVSMSTSRA